METKHDILITGADDFLAPYLFRELDHKYGQEANVWLLGTGEMAGIKADLRQSPTPCRQPWRA